jgi:uncharacterized membrane protein (TIGR02234 family)
MGGARTGRGPRRELTAVVALLLGGGALALVVAQATWVHVRTGGTVGGVAVVVGIPLDLDVSGTQAAPPVLPLAVLAMAGALGLLATRGWARRVLGALLVLAGAGMVVAAVHAISATRDAAAGALAAKSVDAVLAAGATYQLSWWWPALTALAGCLVMAGGAVTVLRSGRWPAMGARFDAPGGRPVGPPADAWSAIDRGEDPTAVQEAPPPVTPAATPTTEMTD